MKEVDRNKIIASNKIDSWNKKYPYTTDKGKQLLETEYADKKINEKRDDIKLSIRSIKEFLESHEKTKMNIEINAELDKLTQRIKDNMISLADQVSKFNASKAEANVKADAYKKEMADVYDKANEMGLLNVLNEANVLSGLSNPDIVVKEAVKICEQLGAEKVSDIAEANLTEEFVKRLGSYSYIKPIQIQRLTKALSKLSK
jgi:F0F1-type ATP synthase membrane subunit b/b'